MDTNTEFEPKEVVVLVNEARIPEKDIFGEPERDSSVKETQIVPQVIQKAEEPNEAVELLRQQLAEKQKEAEIARQQRAHAEAYARQREQEAVKFASQAQDSQHTAFINAIASFERDAEMLETHYANALASGDNHTAAKIQRQMIQVEGRLSQLSQGKEALEAQLEQQRNRPADPPPPEYYRQQQQQYQPDPVKEAISSLSRESAAWVAAHPEVIKDPEANALMTAAHHSALKNNIPVDSPEYFSHLDKALGFNKRQSAPRQQKVMTAAPVSRGGSVNYQAGGQVAVTLTPEQRAYAAEVLGVTDEEYADGMLYYANKGKLSL